MEPRKRHSKSDRRADFRRANSLRPRVLNLPWGPTKSLLFVGAQVRMPISELKDWLAEKIAY